MTPTGGRKFTEMLASPLTMGSDAVVVAIGIFVARALQNGLEKKSRKLVMMIALLVIMVGAGSQQHVHARRKGGLTFFLVPDFEPG